MPTTIPDDPNDPYAKGKAFAAMLGRVAPFALNPVGNVIKAAGSAAYDKVGAPLEAFGRGALGMSASTANAIQTNDQTQAGQYGMNDKGAGFDTLRPAPEATSVPVSSIPVAPPAAAPAGPNFDLAGQNARMAAGLRAASEIGTQPGGAFEAGYRGPLAQGSAYGTPGPGLTMAESGLSGPGSERGLAENFRARAAAKIQDRRAGLAISQANADAGLIGANAHQMTALNQLPIARLNNIPAMLQAQAHQQFAANQIPLAQLHDLTARRGQDLGYAPHAPDVATKTEAARRMSIGDFVGATAILTAGSPRQVHAPLGFEIKEDPVFGRTIMNKSDGTTQDTSIKELQAQAEARMQRELQKKVK